MAPIIIEERVAMATENFRKGYNCAQSVVLAFSDLFGLDASTAAKASCGLGGGVGRMREVCGCISGMAVLTGFAIPFPETPSADAKTANYRFIQEISNLFKSENGSILCGELLGLEEHKPSEPKAGERTPEYYQQRPCERYVASAARIFAEHLSNR